MKKLALKISVLLTGLLTPLIALAQGNGAGFFIEGTAPDVTAQGGLADNVTGLINSILAILGLVAVAFLIYAGVLMVTAGGNDEQVGKARKVITYALVGIIIIVLSWTIVSFVAGLL